MNYAKIKHWDIANGEGVRVSLFVSGCNFHCKDCFNAEAQDFNYGKLYTQETEDEIISLVSDSNIDGLSILGGDPLWQDVSGLHDLCMLVYKIKQLGKTVWVWSGFVWEDIMHDLKEPNDIILGRQALISLCDVFIDGKFEIDKKDIRLHWRGSKNQRIINVKETLKQNKIITLQND